jgi:hypothetical protein
MPSFTKLEKAALDGIFAETPELAPILEQQFDKAAVTNRENTGGGFFTTIEVREDAPRVNGPRVLGCETHARVEGLTHGLGFVLFMEDDRRLPDGAQGHHAQRIAGVDLDRLHVSTKYDARGGATGLDGQGARLCLCLRLADAGAQRCPAVAAHAGSAVFLRHDTSRRRDRWRWSGSAETGPRNDVALDLIRAWGRADGTGRRGVGAV